MAHTINDSRGAGITYFDNMMVFNRYLLLIYDIDVIILNKMLFFNVH